MPDRAPFELEHGGPSLSGETLGEGPDVVLAHGLTATRRYVVMGSRTLPRAGYRLTTYDARGHGESRPAPSRTAYDYSDLVDDLERVVDHLGAERVVVGGASMGAATAVAFALRHPKRVHAVILITPAYRGQPTDDVAEWDALADGLERGGVDGFLAAYEPKVEDRWRDTVITVARQRLERHRYPRAVADALRVVPRSYAFRGLDPLESIDAPALVVGSHDEADPGHPIAVAEQYAERLRRGELVSERRGASPLAWRGGRLSRAIAEFLDARL